MAIQLEGKKLLANQVDTLVSKVRLVVDCYFQSTLDSTEKIGLQDVAFTVSPVTGSLSLSGNEIFTITLGSFDYKEVVGIELTNTDASIIYVEGSFTNGFGFYVDGQFTLDTLSLSFT